MSRSTATEVKSSMCGKGSFLPDRVGPVEEEEEKPFVLAAMGPIARGSVWQWLVSLVHRGSYFSHLALVIMSVVGVRNLVRDLFLYEVEYYVSSCL